VQGVQIKATVSLWPVPRSLAGTLDSSTLSESKYEINGRQGLLLILTHKTRKSQFSLYTLSHRVVEIAPLTDPQFSGIL